MSHVSDYDINSEFRFELQTVLRLCEALNTPRSLTVYLLLTHNEFEQFVDLPWDPSVYEDISNFADDYLITEVLRKSPNIPLGIDRKEAALSSFLDSELSCYYSNMRLRHDSRPSWFEAFRRNVYRILGPLTTSDLDYVQDKMRHGPGATTAIRGVGSVPSDKFDEDIHLTIDLVPFYKSIIGEQWWQHHRRPVDVVEGSRFTTVPKSAKTDRGICVEPTLNMYVQLGIGAAIKKRLRRFGINTELQWRKNRSLAQRAFSEGLSTIDLSAASDSVSTELVYQALPPRWYELLFIPRSHRVMLPDGSYHELEKWSSMGNGYTFELETLLFYALCMTIVPSDELDSVSVFGDDIIVPSRYAHALIEALNFLGFRTNRAKSFLAGNFFESCGADYFKGCEVRPFYLKGSKELIPYALQIANKLRAYSSMRCGWIACDSRFRPVWYSLLRFIPGTWKRCRVPLILGDTGLVSSLEEATQVKRARHDWDAYRVRTIAVSSVKRRKTSVGLLLSMLARQVPPEVSTATLGKEPVRGLYGKPVPRWVFVFNWTQGLSWSD